MNFLLSKIQTGMKVFDQKQHEVGTVEYVQFGDEDPLRPGAETATVSPAVETPRGSWLVEGVADLFGRDDLPETLKDRLLRYGFVRVDAPGLFNADRYIFPNQIQSVEGNRVTLNVTRSELVQRM
jgi:hypothetical protein